MTQTSPAAARQLDAIPVHRKSLSQRLRENWQLYVMLLIPVVLTIVYKYWPMYGIQIAFRDFKASRGITGSEWVGLYWFERFFTAPNCVRMIKNTVLLSLYSLLWSFPIPIILSLCINQLRFAKFKRVVQTVLYAPHFISTMVICGMIKIFLSPSGGLLNLILGTSVDFLSESTAFRTIYVASGIWQEAGWGTIIYMACLAAVDTSLYEAAKIDGASMFQRILHIDIPELVPMIVLQLIMSVGNLMNVGFEKVLLLQTELNKATSDIIAVYVYEQGILNAKYSYSTAIGLFNTLVNIILLIVTDPDFVLRPAPEAVKTSRPAVSNTIRVRAADQSQFLDSLLPRIYRQLFAQRHAGDYCLSELLSGAEYQRVRQQLTNSRVRLSAKEAIVMRLRQYINQHDLPYPGSWIRNA